MKSIVYTLSSVLLFSALLFAQCSTAKKAANTGTQKSETAAAAESDNAAVNIDTRPSVPAEALQGSWVFDYFTTVNTNKTILFPSQLPELTFDTKSKKFSGSAGCNNISGTFSQSGEQLTFKQPMIMTRMSCNASGEKIFIDYITSVRKYTVTGNSLQLIADVKPVMVFKRAGK